MDEKNMIIIDETMDNPKSNYLKINNSDGTLNSEINMNRLYPAQDENIADTSSGSDVSDSSLQNNQINDLNNNVLVEQQNTELSKNDKPFDIARVILLTLIWSGFIILIGSIVAIVIMVCFVHFYSYSFEPADYGVVYALLVYGYAVFFFSLIGELIRKHLEKKIEKNYTGNNKDGAKNLETASINQSIQ